ncbi:MAG: aminodeoxychorismate synthase component I [Candidatus Kariarchaeaceae archaeon]|jgi:para-aminobenzoate synthetase component 1
MKINKLHKELNNHGILGIFQGSETTNPIMMNRNLSNVEEVILCWRPIASIILDANIVTSLGYLSHIKDENEFWQYVPDMLTNIGDIILEPFFPEGAVYGIIRDYCGLYGYISYEANRSIEKFNHRADKEILPTVIMSFPSIYLIEKRNNWIYIELDGKEIEYPKFPLNFDTITNDDQIHSNLAFSEYIEKIERVKDYIFDGDIYQTNFTKQFSISVSRKDYRTIYCDLIEQHPVPFSSYLEFPTFSILSLSPELFIRVKNGRVTTKPIKGTRPRGKDKSEDEHLAIELLNSEKDHAELTMIVDLLRNDLGKSSDPGSVEVVKHAELESFSNVHHLVSTITSTIPKNSQSSWRLFLRAFPGGSITGCPKIRSMEIIEELETISRGVYTGSIGYLTLNGDLEFNIGIRTAIAAENTVIFNAGGGIVADSIPIDEYTECLHKAKHFAAFFNKTFTGHILWYNNRFYSTDEFSLPEKHTNSKEGCFETMLVKNSKIQKLPSHLNRLNRAINFYGINPILPTNQDINQLISLNLASDARIKLILSIDSNNKVSCSAHIEPYEITSDPVKLLLARKQIKPPEIVNKGIKPLEYDIYRNATRHAIENGYWDCILIDDKNILLETGRANIYIYTDQWLTPENNVVQGIIRGILISENLAVSTDLTVEDLLAANAIVISNSLNGVRQVNRIYDEQSKNILWEYKEDTKSINSINQVRTLIKDKRSE